MSMHSVEWSAWLMLCLLKKSWNIDSCKTPDFSDLEYEDHEKFDLIDGLIFRKGIDKPRFVIPESMVVNIIRIYHDEMAHCGVEKTVQGICCG